MRNFITSIFILIVFILQSCHSSLTDFGANWTNEIKQKIIEDANQIPTNTIIDTSRNEMTIYRNDKKLKYYYFKTAIDSLGEYILKDTGISIFYSSDQKFELVRELCPASDRSFEGVRYKGVFVGLSEFKYCNGRIKEQGFRFYGDIGTWVEFDQTGKIIRETDKGNEDEIMQLQNIRYYR